MSLFHFLLLFVKQKLFDSNLDDEWKYCEPRNSLSLLQPSFHRRQEDFNRLLFCLSPPLPQKYCLPKHQERQNQLSCKFFLPHLNQIALPFKAPPFHNFCQYSIIIHMNIFDKIGRAISQRQQQAFDNLGKGIEGMATSFDNFDFETLSSKISKKMMVHLDAIGNYLMEGGNQDEILDKLGKKIEEKQELAFDPVLEYFNKHAYELDQNLFGKVVKFQEDKSHQRGHVEIIRKTSMRSRSSSAGSCNSKRKPRPPSSQEGSIKRKRSLVKSIRRNRTPSQDSCDSLKKPMKASPKNRKRSSSGSRSIKRAKQLTPKSSQRSSSGSRSIKKIKQMSPKSSQRSSSGSLSIKKIKRISPKSSRKSSSGSDTIKRARPGSSQGKRSPSVESQKSVEAKQEVCRQDINETEPVPCSDDNNEVRQINCQESPQIEVQLVPNPHVKQQEEQEVARDNVEILVQRTERLETRFHRAEKLKAEFTKLHPLTQKAEEKPQEEGEQENKAGHQTLKIEVVQANPDKKEEVSPTDNAETVKKSSSPQKQQGSAERPIKRQKTPPRMPYNIDIQYPKSAEKNKSLTPKKL